MKTFLSLLALFVAHCFVGLASAEEVDWETFWSGTPWIAFIFVIAILKLRIKERIEPLGNVTKWLFRSY